MEDFEIIGWPEIQELMDSDGFSENATLIEPNDNLGIGSSTYLVDKKWLEWLNTSESEIEEILYLCGLFKVPIEGLNLSTRSYQCMKNRGVKTLGDMAKLSKKDLLNTYNFGKKSLAELEDLFECLNLSFGMDVEKLNVFANWAKMKRREMRRREQ